MQNDENGSCGQLQIVGILNGMLCDLIGDTGVAALNVIGTAHIGQRFQSAVFLVLSVVLCSVLRIVLSVVLGIVLRFILGLVLHFVLFVHDGTSLT